MRMLPRERRRAKDREAQLVVFVDSFAAAALKGMEDHDRWLLARRQLERKLAGRRSTSKLPALIDLVMGRPVVSTGMVAKALSVTPRAAQDLVAELGLRETTGKGATAPGASCEGSEPVLHYKGKDTIARYKTGSKS